MAATALGKIVLLVEDDRLIREGLAMTLEAAGYSVRHAANGREALRALRDAEQPSVILLDIVMPEMNGWEFLRERDAQAPASAAVPVIVFSAACEVMPHAAPPRGVARFLPKPATCQETLEALGELFDAIEQQA